MTLVKIIAAIGEFSTPYTERTCHGHTGIIGEVDSVDVSIPWSEANFAAMCTLGRVSRSQMSTGEFHLSVTTKRVRVIMIEPPAIDSDDEVSP